ncbi:aquaporin-like protein [Pholiota molesta]|nr:aquaporin-like protein [Pholiota molesta]
MSSVPDVSKLPDPEAPLPERSTCSTLARRSEHNYWQRLRYVIREPMAEFLGVAVFIIFGAGADCSVVLSTNPNVASSHKGEFISTNFGWAIGLASAVWISAGISGGHVNPAITLALATWRGFPWKKVPIYIFAQVMGGVVGAGLVYGQYIHAIDIFEGGRHIRTQATASLFSSFALNYMTAVSCFFSEFLGTAVLAFMIMAATDKNNAAPPLAILPFVIFLTLLGLGAALGMQTAFAFNPARDFGPRLFLSMAGYGKEVYTFRNEYWLWCMILAPILGAQCAVGLYDLFLYDPQGANAPKPKVLVPADNIASGSGVRNSTATQP